MPKFKLRKYFFIIFIFINFLKTSHAMLLPDNKNSKNHDSLQNISKTCLLGINPAKIEPTRLIASSEWSDILEHKKEISFITSKLSSEAMEALISKNFYGQDLKDIFSLLKNSSFTSSNNRAAKLFSKQIDERITEILSILEEFYGSKEIVLSQIIRDSNKDIPEPIIDAAVTRYSKIICEKPNPGTVKFFVDACDADNLKFARALIYRNLFDPNKLWDGFPDEGILQLQIMLLIAKHYNKDFAKYLNWFLRFNGDINLLDSFGDSILQKAVREKYIEEVKILLKIPNININIRGDKLRRSALHLAVENHSIELVEILVNAGANFNILTNQWHTPLHYAVVFPSEEPIPNYFKKIMLILSRLPDFNINQVNHWGDSTLMHASSAGDYYAVNELVKINNIQLNHKNRFGNTALHYAVKEGYLDIVKILIVSDKILLNLKNDNEKSPLDIAFEQFSKYNQENNLEEAAKYSKIWLALQEAGAVNSTGLGG